jgi:hypothetical protein
MLEPRCKACGGLLEAVRPGGGAADVAPFRAEFPQLSPAFGRVLRVGVLALLFFSAARFGLSAGGLGLAIAAIGVVGLFTVPLMVRE